MASGDRGALDGQQDWHEASGPNGLAQVPSTNVAPGTNEHAAFSQPNQRGPGQQRALTALVKQLARQAAAEAVGACDASEPDRLVQLP